MKSKNVLITGSSHGIGAAIARRFASEGMTLVLNCKTDAASLEALARELRDTYHVTVLTYVCDVADDCAVKKMCDDIAQTIGGIDILINNAGISKICLLTDMSIADWNDMIGTNLTSVFSCTRHVLDHMIHVKYGHIINISSVWGNVGASCEVAYSTTKGGINAFTKALAKELAPSNIKVNAIACGIIDTRMNAEFSAEEKQILESEVPIGRFGRPDEVADFAWQLANAPDYLTGQVITLDGGWQ